MIKNYKLKKRIINIGDRVRRTDEHKKLYPHTNVLEEGTVTKIDEGFLTDTGARFAKSFLLPHIMRKQMEGYIVGDANDLITYQSNGQQQSGFSEEYLEKV